MLWSLLTAAALGNEALWVQQPAISPDGASIAFAYRGDLWLVPATGGTARPLTTHPANDAHPVWSNDGAMLAFSSDRHGQRDVFVMPSTGGPARRLTVHGHDEVPSSFTPDDASVLFSALRQDAPSSRVFPNGRMGELYAVGVGGGAVRQVLTTPAERARVRADGLIVYHDWKGYEDPWRKHHTSSVTRDLRTYDPAANRHKKLTDFAGEDRDPVFSPGGNRVFFLSERGEAGPASFNVHAMPLEGGPVTQLTTFDHHPVRDLSIANDGTLCFRHHGAIYTLREGAAPQRVPITIAADAGRLEPRFWSATQGATEVAVSPDGREVAFVVRGEVFVASVEEGTTRRITTTPAPERSVSFSPDGRSLLYASERNGSWDLFTTRLTRDDEPLFARATVLDEQPLLATPAETFQPVWSPDGQRVAFLEERTTVRVLDVKTGEVRTVVPGDRNYSYADGDQHVAWSPDSRWLFVEFLHPDQWITQAGMVPADGSGPLVNLSRSGYGHGYPVATANGAAMLTFSQRDGMKNHASWGGQTDVYATFFTQEAFDRFHWDKERYALWKAAEDERKAEADDDKKPKKKKKGTDPVDWALELEGIEERRVRLTPFSAELGGAVMSLDGERLLLLAKLDGAFDLWSITLRTKESKVLAELGADEVSYLRLTADGKHVVFVRDGRVARVGVDDGKVHPVAFTAELLLDAPAERLALFEHVWRQVKKKFYDPGLHGVDWDFYKAEYLRVLPSVGDDEAFAELLSEMLGELNASHTGARFFRSASNADETASLGLLYEDARDPSGAWIVAEVLPRGPAHRADARIQPGVRIEAIDGDPLRPDEDPYGRLNRRAGRPTRLSLFDPAAKARWEVVLTPNHAHDEANALYDRWVRRNEAEVARLSDGKLGYVHVRGMDHHSYRQVYDDALGRHHDKEGLVVDTRFNGGGWLHDDLATFLGGEPYMWVAPRGQKLGSEPMFKWSKPSVVVVSEGNYSDAHMFPVAYRALGIGPIVGMPVPGTGTAVWWEKLQNGLVFGIPQVGMFDAEGRAMENLQLEPDVRQDNPPELVSSGRDPQLEAAVKALLERVSRP